MGAWNQCVKSAEATCDGLTQLKKRCMSKVAIAKDAVLARRREAESDFEQCGSKGHKLGDDGLTEATRCFKKSCRMFDLNDTKCIEIVTPKFKEYSNQLLSPHIVKATVETVNECRTGGDDLNECLADAKKTCNSYVDNFLGESAREHHKS